MKPKLLVLELWALGDLAMASPFLRAAVSRFDVTLLAKPLALELQPRLWPGVEVVPFVFPWTAFHGKYLLYRWPWRNLLTVARRLRSCSFSAAVSARPDPRDQGLMWLAGARRRLGFPRAGGGLFLTDKLALPRNDAHRCEHWRLIAETLDLDFPTPPTRPPLPGSQQTILIHSGAAQPVRVWPLERFAGLAERLRNIGFHVLLACDKDQRAWWQSRREDVSATTTATELLNILDKASLFIGNDSGPGHLAAMLGIPTFTLFGNQIPSRIAPFHPAAEWIEGSPCPFKPCRDYCHFPQPNCLLDISEDAVWMKVKEFVCRHFPSTPSV